MKRPEFLWNKPTFDDFQRWRDRKGWRTLQAGHSRETAALDAHHSQLLSDAVLKAALDCVIIIDGKSAVLEWNPASERTFGISRADAVGKDLTNLIIPPEQREAHRRGMSRFLQTGEAHVLGRRIEVEALTASGRRMPVELAITVVRVGDDVRFAAYLRDLTAQRESEAALFEGQQRLRATYEHAFAAIGEVDALGAFLRVNEQFSVITGFSREELLARSIWDITHPADAGAERDLFTRQMAGKLPRYSVEKRYIHKDGHEVWVELAASTVDDPMGRPVYGVRVARDVTDRRLWDERQRLLINELNHRVKNTLATVQSIAAQSIRSDTAPEESLNSFLDRLKALSRAHDLLTQQSWEGADIRAVIERGVEPFRGQARDCFRIDGPPTWLEPQRALALALALHELAINAAKYGVLASPAGSVSIRWTITADGDAAGLEFTWSERGGPPVVAPLRTGFGRRLLERAVPRDFGGSAELQFWPEGLGYSIQAPLSEQRPSL
jgi:PAS domain S-box-containing protein